MKYIGFITLLFFLIVPSLTNAETVLRTGANIYIESGHVIEGDYYVSVAPFGTTVMSGTVKGDMYAVGASVTVNGEVEYDLTILSGKAGIHAPVLDDVRVFAGEVIIADYVGGDVFIMANSLTILSTATISGDVFFFGENLSIEGDVNGSVLGSAINILIDSTIGNDIDVTAVRELTIADSAVIQGSVRYISLSYMTRAQGSVIYGDIQKIAYGATTVREQIYDTLSGVFMLLFSLLCVYLIARREITLVVESVDQNVLKNFLIGIIVLLLGFLASILLMVTVLGLFVGIVMMTVVILLFVLGLILSSAILGAFILKLFKKKPEVTLISILVGTVVLNILLLVPLAGIPVLFILLTVVVGALSQRIYRVITSNHDTLQKKDENTESE